MESQLLRICLKNFVTTTQERKVNAKAKLKTARLVCAFVRPTSVQEEKGQKCEEIYDEMLEESHQIHLILIKGLMKGQSY